MPFLVLTRDGFDDLRAKSALTNATVYINPGILSAEEIKALEGNGTSAHVLPQIIDPHVEVHVKEAILSISAHGTEPIWLEASSALSAGQAAKPPESDSSRADAGVRARLHEQLLEGAALALSHLRKIRASGKRLLIIPYLGYGDAHRISLRGRVLEDEGIDPQTHESSRWENFIGLYKRLESDQIPGARVLARFQGVECETTTDRGGYFSIDMELPAPLASSGWHTVELTLLDPAPKDGNRTQATGSVLIPPPSARFGVISDIDDTVLWTNVTNKLNMMLMLARSNAHTRKPFKGVAAFYRALHEGASGKECNPIFYVSSSPWHLFEPLLEFLRMQDIPVGPLMLKELGLRKIFGQDRHLGHKLTQIENIVRMYPKLPFVLIGDSGEQDPEIYAEVVRRFPNAVRVIYIRNVNPDPSRIEAIDRLIDEVRTTGAQLIVTPDSEFAATHAASEGLIRPKEVASIRLEQKIEDAQDSNPLLEGKASQDEDGGQGRPDL